MASTVLVDSYEELLDALEDEGVDDGTVAVEMTDNEKALIESGRKVVEDYYDASAEKLEQAHDMVRQKLSDLLVWVNQHRPQMAGTQEVQRATEALSERRYTGGTTPYVPTALHNAPAAALTDEGNAEAAKRGQERIQQDNEAREREERERDEAVKALTEEHERQKGQR